MSNSLERPVAVFERNIAAGSNPAYYVPGVAVSGTATVTSKATTPSKDKLVTYMVTADADAGQALVGTFTVEWSNSTQLEFDRGEEKWNTYDALTTAIPAINLASGAATTFGIELIDIAFYKLRLKFVTSSGQGYVFANVVVA